MKRRDFLLILGIGIAVVVSYLVFVVAKPKAQIAIVRMDGQILTKMPLDKDAQYAIDLGEKHNLVTIQSGEVFMQEASCPDKVCINQGKKSRSGQSIVCLPNKVLVELEGGAQQALDAVSG